MHPSATIGMHRRLLVGIFVVGIEPWSAPTTKYKRPTAVSWAFSFVLPSVHAGNRHIPQVDAG